jgi:hypothetical protein
MPLARHADGLTVTQVHDELVVYDSRRNHALSLNPTAAFVFRHCDGGTSSERLSALLAAEYHLGRAQATEVAWLALNLLGEAHLLQEKVKRPGPSMSRRRVLKMLGVTAALLPVAKSIAAPTPAQASSSGPPEPLDPPPGEPAPHGFDYGGDL